MDNENLDHRKNIFTNYKSFLGINNHINSFQQTENNRLELKCLNLNSTIFQKQDEQVSNAFFINNVFDNSRLMFDNNVFVLNCHFKLTNVEVGKNTILNDVFLVLKIKFLHHISILVN
jgi:hypothetical protein